MPTTRLELYNDALLICGERFLTGLTEDREPRYLLDHVWDTDGVRHCLEKGQWVFAMRGAKIDYAPAVTPQWGYSRAFTKPADWITTSAICTDEYFSNPLLEYVEETGYFFCDLDEIYVRYVSNDSSYGGDLTLWPTLFVDYVASHFAARIILKLTSDKTKRDEVLALERQRLREAKNQNAMGQPAKFLPSGSWVRSRGMSRRERGKRNTLIG